MSELPNASAAAYAWLAAGVRASGSGLWEDWWRPLDELVNRGPPVIWTDPWPHDYWVAQGVRYVESGSAVQTWRHMGPLDRWPLLEARGVAGTATRPEGLDVLLAAADPAVYDHRRVLDAFAAYVAAEREVPAHGRTVRDPELVKAALVRAWLYAVLGSSLSGLVLSPTEDAEILGHETLRRLERAWSLAAGHEVAQVKAAYAVEALYTAQWIELEPSLVETHQGQAVEAHDHWFWLTRELAPEHAREAARVAAELLVSPPVLAALLHAAAGPADPAVLAVCALRRWLLGLRAMAWLEQALQHRWRDVRTADVVAFAYAAVAPWWPRPSVAISHRSGDVKAELMKLGIWGVPHVAIDAVTVPSRETNTGFVWRLFAATPTLVRVRTAHYEASAWCRREAELAQYLLDEADFLAGRVVADADVPALHRVDRALTPLTAGGGQTAPAFPPRTLVLEVPSQPPLIVRLFAAVCTLRLLHGLIDDVDTVNLIADLLTNGEVIDAPPPTNDPGGWRVHAEAFAALAPYAGGQRAPVRLASAYPEDQREHDVEGIVNRIPDLRAIACSSTDVLAALEWDREIRRWFSDRWGARAVVDCRGLAAEGWAAADSHALERGLLELRTETLVFVAQDAGQQVDRWPVIATADPPILTQYEPGQFSWLMRSFAYPTWLAAYVSLPDFEFAPPLHDAAFAALESEFAAHAGALAVPEQYSDVFGVETDEPLFLDALRRPPGDE